MRPSTPVYRLIRCPATHRAPHVRDTVLRSNSARYWETPEQGYPSDESGAEYACVAPSSRSARDSRLGELTVGLPSTMGAAHIECRCMRPPQRLLGLRAQVRQIVMLHGTSHTSAVPFAIAPTFLSLHGAGNRSRDIAPCAHVSTMSHSRRTPLLQACHASFAIEGAGKAPRISIVVARGDKAHTVKPLSAGAPLS